MRRILAIKHGALGDIIQGIDAYASLRAHFTDAHITILTSRNFASLMRAMPYFDEVAIDDRAPFYHLSKLRQIALLFRNEYDVIIDWQCSKRTNLYHKLFVRGSKRWLGTATGCSDPYPDQKSVNNKDRMLAAPIMLGAPAIQGSLAFLALDEKAATQHEFHQITPPYAVLMPGCSPAKPSKKWPASHYAKLANLLHEQGIQPIVIGTKVDSADCEAIASASRHVVNLCGQTDLAALAHLCARAQFCIGNDSGPVFLAAKTGAVTMMVMGPDTNPDMSAPTGAASHYLKSEALSQLSSEQVFETLLSLK